MESVIILFRDMTREKDVDLEVPLAITAREFILALNKTYHLGIDPAAEGQIYLRMEYPVALLHGDDLLGSFGMRTGSVVYFER